MVSRESSKTCQNIKGLFFAVVVGEPTWGEGHEYDTDSENHGGNELKGKREEPRSVLLVIAGSPDVVSAVVDPELKTILVL